MTGVTHKQVLELFRYDPITGLLYWRNPTRGPQKKNGGVAGRQNKEQSRYSQIKINGKPYQTHKLVWFYVHGVWPKKTLDHIDQDGMNNRIENLRECVGQHNNANRRAPANKMYSNLKGVSKYAGGKWVASIKKNGKSKYLGMFLTAEEAHAAYCKAAKELFGEFACTQSKGD